MLRFFSYSFSASDCSEESTAGRVVSPCSIMVLHGLGSKEARRARMRKYRSCQTTSHSSLSVARQGDVSRELNLAFLLGDSFNFNYVDEERSDIFQKVHCMFSRKLMWHIKTRDFTKLTSNILLVCARDIVEP